MYLNKAIVAGNLTRDPELRSLPSGAKVANFSLATNRFWKDQNGQRQQSTDYHNIVVFGRQAETAAQYLKKGSQALVEGRMQTRSWDDQSGQKKYRTEIVADRVQFGNPAGSNNSSNQSAESNTSEQSQGSDDGMEYPDDDINPEDIPF
jgi:single-strand DNA-binding protein